MIIKKTTLQEFSKRVAKQAHTTLLSSIAVEDMKGIKSKAWDTGSGHSFTKKVGNIPASGAGTKCKGGVRFTT